MTNPFINFEHEIYSHEYMMLQQGEQITATNPATIKSLVEVYRDTANQLNAQTMRLEQEKIRHDETLRELKHEEEVVAAHQDTIKRLEDGKKFAEKTSEALQDELADYNKRFEKIYRHRNELADIVQNSRKTLTELDEWLDKYDNGEAKTEPVEVLLMIAAMLRQNLKVEAAEEQEEEQ